MKIKFDSNQPYQLDAINAVVGAFDGQPLAAKVEKVEAGRLPVYSVAKGQLLICLENPITQDVLRGMMALEPVQTAFHGNDPLKTNAVLESRSHGITFRTV